MKVLTKALVTALLLAAAVSASAQPVAEWTARYNGGYFDRGLAVAADDSGNVIVTGESRHLAFFGTEDIATVKYSPSGTVLWTRRYNGPIDGLDRGAAVAVDRRGNCYVTGSSAGIGTEFDYVTIKYRANGDTAWIARYNGPASSYDDAYAVGVDARGNVYVTGSSIASTSGADYATLKYDSSGVFQWVMRYNGPGNAADAAYALAVDDTGNVYVTGSSAGSGTSYDYATIKYSTTGVVRWTMRYDGPGHDKDDAYAIAPAPGGGVFVTGMSRTGSTVGTGDWLTIRYAADGRSMWSARYDGPGAGADEARAVAADAAGNCVVTGWSTGVATGIDVTTVRYTPSGDTSWARRYSGPGAYDDQGRSLAVDSAGNVAVAGFRRTGVDESTEDCVVLKYSATGSLLWSPTYNGPGGVEDRANAVAFSTAGRVVMAGESWSGVTLGTSDYVTIRYSGGGSTGVGEQPENVPGSVALLGNFPNPFNPVTTIRFHIGSPARVSLKVYDLAGRDVATVAEGEFPAGDHERVFDAAGLATGAYFCRLSSGAAAQTLRLLLVR